MARTADEIKEAVKDHYGERARTVAAVAGEKKGEEAPSCYES